MARRSEREAGPKPRQEPRARERGDDIEGLRARVAELEQDKARLEAALLRSEDERKSLSAEFVDGEQSHTALARLFVATERIHASLDRGEVLLALHEIITNIIGGAEYVVFEVDPSRSALRLAASLGIDEERFQTVPFGEGAIGRVASTGTPHFTPSSARHAKTAAKAAAKTVKADAKTAAKTAEKADVNSGDGSDVTACIPLKRGDTVTGAIAIFRLLAHKSSLTDADREVLSVLIPHAALALYCCALESTAAG